MSTVPIIDFDFALRLAHNLYQVIHECVLGTCIDVRFRVLRATRVHEILAQ